MRTFPAEITADDPVMVAHSKYVLSQFGSLGKNCALLVNGYVAGGTAITVARRKFIRQFLRYQRVVQGAITSPQTQRGFSAFVHTKISRVIGATGIHVGTMCFGQNIAFMLQDNGAEASDKSIAFMLQEDEADGPYYHQKWQGMPQTTPIISNGFCLAIASVLREFGPLQRHFDSRWRCLRPQGWTQAGRYLLRSGRGVLDAVEGWQIRRRVSFRWRHRVFQDS